MMFPVAVTNPVVIKLLPVMLPVALTPAVDGNDNTLLVGLACNNTLVAPAAF